MRPTFPFYSLKTLIVFLFSGLGVLPVYAQELPPQFLQMEKGLDTVQGAERYSLLMDLARFSSEFDIKRSRKYIQSAYDLGSELNDPAFQARALNGMGITYFMQGNLDSALVFYRKSLDINIAALDSAGLAINYSNLSNVHVELGDYNKAIEYFFSGLTLSRLMKDSTTQADIHNNLARLYKRLKMYDESIRHTKQSIEIYKLIGKEDYIANFNNLGISYEDLGKEDSAIYFFRNCVKLAIKNEQKLGLYLASTNIAGALTAKGQLDSARYYLNLALNDSNLKDNPRYLLTVGVTDVQVLLNEGQYEIALKKGLEYLQMAKATRRIKEEANLYGHIQAAYAALGDFKEAYRYFMRYNHLNDSLRSESNLTEITRVQERYEYQIQKQRLEDEHAEALKDEKIQKQRSYYLLGFLGLLSLFLGYTAIIRRRRNKVLRSKNFEIERQNQEIQEQDEELRAQKRNLEALNNFKDRILAVMAHDLKSPLNSLQGLLDLSAMDALQDPSLVKEMMAKLAGQLVIVRQSVENLLHWARLQLGAVGDHNHKSTPLAETLDEVLDLYQGMADSKEINLKVEHESPDINLAASPEILRIVLRNLISNALKFSPAKGEVVIQSQLEASNCRVSIRDHGPGLKPEQQALMFSETMHSTVGSGNEKGTGLGLYLSGEFIRSERGRIGVKSELGKGSEFWFTLPIKG